MYDADTGEPLALLRLRGVASSLAANASTLLTGDKSGDLAPTIALLLDTAASVLDVTTWLAAVFNNGVVDPAKAPNPDSPVAAAIHTRECIEITSNARANAVQYEVLFPRYCRHCSGRGNEPGTDDPCEDCLARGRCPRCSKALAYSKDNGPSCAACGWVLSDPGKPRIPDCVCREVITKRAAEIRARYDLNQPIVLGDGPTVLQRKTGARNAK